MKFSHIIAAATRKLTAAGLSPSEPRRGVFWVDVPSVERNPDGSPVSTVRAYASGCGVTLKVSP